VQGPISKLVQIVLPQDNGLMLFLAKPSHPYFLPIAERTLVGQRHSFGKLRQREFGFIQADWGFSVCTTQVREIVPVIICIILDVEYPWQWAQICNPFDICILRFCMRQESFCCEANGMSPRRTGRRSRWRSKAGRNWLIDWIVSW